MNDSAVVKSFKNFGLTRTILVAFFLLLVIVAAIQGTNIPVLMGDILRRWGMFGVLALAMVPAIQSGIGPNFGVSIGIIGGLLGALISVEMRYRGFFEAFADNPTLDAWVSVLVAIVIALFFAVIFGIVYGILLNRVKGNEMVVSTYVGFSIVSLFSIMWLILPFRSGTSIWPIAGQGLRTAINLVDDFGGVFNNFLAFGVGEPPQRMNVPTGLLLVFFVLCFLMFLFSKSRTGMMMSAAGANPAFAKAAGINVNRMRIIGTTISTALGAVGIIVYAQSFGFLQLYTAPLMMGFTSVAAVLIGGASVGRARVFNVLLGAVLFQGILTVSMPVANVIMPGGILAEVTRLIVSNGIILYALSRQQTGGLK